MANPFNLDPNATTDATQPDDPLMQVAQATPDNLAGAGERSTFQRTFDPDRAGSLFGLIGQMSGVPTAAERQAAEGSKLIQMLSAALPAANGRPDVAANNVFKSPEGMKFLAHPGMLDFVKQWKDMITPPPISQMETQPGNISTFQQSGKLLGTVKNPTAKTQEFQAGVPELATTPAGGQTTPYVQGKPQSGAVSQPTAEVQKFQALRNELSAAANKPEIIDQLVMNEFSPNAEAQFQTNVQRLVANKAISVDLGNRLAAGFRGGGISIVPVPDAEGNPTGTYMSINGDPKVAPKDRIKYLIPGTDPNEPQTSIPSGVPGGRPYIMPNTPHARNPDGSWNQAALSDKRFMGLWTGPVGRTLSVMGTAVRYVDPVNNEPLTQAIAIQHGKLDQLEAQLLGISKSSRPLAASAKALLDMIPSKWTDARDAYNQLENLHHWLDTNISQEKAYVDPRNAPNTDAKGRIASREIINSMSNVKALLPSLEEINQVRVDMGKGTQPDLTIPRAGQTIYGLAKEGVTGIVKGIKNLRQPGTAPFSQPGATGVTSQPQGPQVDIKSVPTMSDDQIEALGDPANLPADVRGAVIERLLILQKGNKRGAVEEKTRVAEGLPNVPSPPTAPTSPWPPTVPLSPRSPMG